MAPDLLFFLLFLDLSTTKPLKLVRSAFVEAVPEAAAPFTLEEASSFLDLDSGQEESGLVSDTCCFKAVFVLAAISLYLILYMV